MGCMKIIRSSVQPLWGFFGQVLAAEKAPFMLALFFAAAGWTVVRSTDRLSTLPLAEYQVSTAIDDQRVERTAIRLRNITSSSRFGCFNLTVAAAANSPFRIDVSKSHSLIIGGGVLSRVSRVAWEREIARFDIQEFAPGADIEIVLRSQGGDEPRLLVSSCQTEMPASSAAEPILVKKSLKSWLVENEILILWALLGVWLVALIAMFGAQRRSKAEWRD